MNPKEYKPITMQEFTDKVRKILLRKPIKSLYENRKPSKEELNKKWTYKE